MRETRLKGLYQGGGVPYGYHEVFYKLLLYRFFIAGYMLSCSGQAGIVVVYVACHRRSAYPDHFALTIAENKFAE